MSTTPPTSASDSDNRRVSHARRTHLSEDWLATIVGLVLLALVLSGVVTDAVVP